MNLPPSFIKTFDGGYLPLPENYIMVTTKTIENKVFRVWLPVDNTRLLLVDNESRLWVYHIIRPKIEAKRSFFALPCQPYCPQKIKRLHFSCFWCRARRIMKEKIANPVQCMIFIETVYSESKLKQVIVKNLRSLISFVGGI